MALPLQTIREINCRQYEVVGTEFSLTPKNRYCAGMAMKQFREVWMDMFRPGWRADIAGNAARFPF